MAELKYNNRIRCIFIVQFKILVYLKIYQLNYQLIYQLNLH